MERLDGVGWFTMLLFWALVIVGVIAVIRWAGARGTTGSRPYGDTPLEILKRRYASGEITKEQYEAMKRDLV
jgi:putative membrane protein